MKPSVPINAETVAAIEPGSPQSLPTFSCPGVQEVFPSLSCLTEGRRGGRQRNARWGRGNRRRGLGFDPGRQALQILNPRSGRLAVVDLR